MEHQSGKLLHQTSTVFRSKWLLFHEDAEFGDFLYHTPFTDREDIIGNVPVTYSVNRAERQITEKRYSQLRPFFLFTDKRVIEHTLSNTTQYGRTLLATHSIKDTLKSRFPANNVHRRHEPVATDTIFADVPAIYSGGCKMAQGYVGRYSMVADAYLMKSEKEFVQTLTDTIRHRGAMDMFWKGDTLYLDKIKTR